jgi:biotin carboxyl carrier protein
MIKHTIRTLIKTGVFLTFTCFLFAGCSNTEKDTADEPKASTSVTITHVSVEPLTEYIELNANSVYQKKNIIRSTTSGVVQLVGVTPGDRVHVGEVLFSIITKEALALIGKSMPGDTSFHFKGEMNIKASKGGIVSTVSHQQGDYVQEGDELATIADQNSLVFMLQAPYELNDYIKPGQHCSIALPDKDTIKGIIGSILPSMDIQAQTTTLVVKPITALVLPENLIAKIQIAKSTKKRTNTLPEEAVLTNETQTDFWVMKLINDTIAVRVPIKKGIETNGTVEIVQPSFLAADRIILTGNYGLDDTARVNIITK